MFYILLDKKFESEGGPKNVYYQILYSRIHTIVHSCVCAVQPYSVGSVEIYFLLFYCCKLFINFLFYTSIYFHDDDGTHFIIS